MSTAHQLAHDGPDARTRLIVDVDRAVERHGTSYRLLMDLAGPKIPTGPLESGPAALKIRPKRDFSGRVSEPARIWFHAHKDPRPSPAPAGAAIPVPGGWLRQFVRGDRIHLIDERAASREWNVVAIEGDGCWGGVQQNLLRRQRHVAAHLGA